MLPFPEEYGPDPALIGDDVFEWCLARVMPPVVRLLHRPWVAPLPDGARKAFVFTSGHEPTRFGHYAEICRDHADWAYHELDGPHFLVVSHPEEVASIILDA